MRIEPVRAASLLVAAMQVVEARHLYDPNQPRDARGRFEYYHATSTRNEQSIREHGLLAGGKRKQNFDISGTGDVYLTKSKKEALQWGGVAAGEGRDVLLVKVHIPEEHRKKLFGARRISNERRFEGDIPKEWIRSITRVKARDLSEFVEEEHPRDEAGKFTDKGGSPLPKALTTGKVTSSEKVDGSINHVERLVLEDEQGNKTEAMFKPESGESWTGGEQARRQFEETYGVTPESRLGQKIIYGDYNDPEIQKLPAFDPDDYGDFEDDVPMRESITNRSFTYADREAAAYEVDQALGLNVVPPTTVRSINGERGMVQQYVESDDNLNVGEADPDSIYGAAILDVAIGNTDRHYGNYLISSGRFVAIDQGLSFPDMPGEYRPDAVVTAIQRLGDKTMSDGFFERVKQKLEDTDWEKMTQKWHISDEEEKQFLNRIEKMRSIFDEYDASPEEAVREAMNQLASENQY